VLSAINLGWLLLTGSMNLFFAALDILSVGQRYLFISIAALGCLVAWRGLPRNAIFNNTPKAHGHLLRFSRGPRQLDQSVTFAEATWSRGLAKEIRRGADFRSTQVRTLTPTSSALRIVVELGRGADVERVERLALQALRTLDWGKAVVDMPCARQRLADGCTHLQIRFCVSDVARGRLHVLSDARASLWDCLHTHGIAFTLRYDPRQRDCWG
jgi:hypothetical protein